jgi:hypothetical protein
MKKFLLENPRLSALAVASGTIVFVLDVMTPRGVAIPMLYSGLVLLGLWSPYSMFAPIAAVIATLLSVLGFFLSPQGGIPWISAVNLLLALVMIWMVTYLVLWYKRVEQATKILSGLLPICAWCKKIRDDKGYWEKLEDYMERHTEAHFTHGICQECLKQWEEKANQEIPGPDPGISAK